MATTINLRPLLHRKQAEMCAPSPVASAAGVCVSKYYSAIMKKNFQAMISSASSAFWYSPDEDAWVAMPNPSLAGTFGAGTCAEIHPVGPSSTGLAGGTTLTIKTSLTIPLSLEGFPIRVTAGSGAGSDCIIESNTIGANSIITVKSATPFNAATDATSAFTIFSGRYWVMNAGTVAAGIFKYFDYATQTWNNGGTTGLPASWGTDGQLEGTYGGGISIDTGTATAGAATTLTIGTKAWTVNQWANHQVRITSGTGKGQVRTISSNTATVLTVSTAWTTTPDTTSVISIEGNDDYMYLMGNNAVTLYRYSISSATWTALAPTTARSAAPGAGASLNWISGCTHAAFKDSSGNTLQGRYLYSFRGGATASLDRYNIALNTWENDISYGFKSETFNTGSAMGYDGGDGMYIHKDTTGRFFRYSVGKNMIEPFYVITYPQGAAAVGDRLWMTIYEDGATKIPFVYFMLNTSNIVFRVLEF